MSEPISMDFHTGYLKCLEDLTLYMKEVKSGGAAVTPSEIAKHFIIPKIYEQQRNIDSVMDEMYQEYLKDEIKRNIKNNIT